MSATPRVRRSTRTSRVGLGLLLPALPVLAMVPFLVDRGTQQNLVLLFSLVVMGTMWNLLAGYAGMVSIGQQAYVGLGAYGLVYFADVVGLPPLPAILVGVLVVGALSVPVSFLAFKLSGGYFAIGTWVLAEVARILVSQSDTLGSGAGATVAAFSDLSPGRRIAYVYWLALAAAVGAVLVTHLLMRSRLGLGFTTIRDDETAAASLGLRVTRSKRVVYVVSSMGCALAGGIIAANTLRVQPDSAFSLTYAVSMIFIVVIGGIGTIEGPIIGAVVFFVLQQQLSELGSWYLVILGLIAIGVTVFLPRGLWGALSAGGRIRFFPVGYRLVLPPDPAAPTVELAPAGPAGPRSGRSTPG